MVLLLVAFRVNMEQRVQHRLLIDILKNPHIVVFEFVYDSLPAMWKEANTTESPDTLICGTLDQTFQNEFASGWCWQVKCLCCPVDIYPLFQMVNLQARATCFETYMLHFPRCCLFGQRNSCHVLQGDLCIYWYIHLVAVTAENSLTVEEQGMPMLHLAVWPWLLSKKLFLSIRNETIPSSTVLCWMV